MELTKEKKQIKLRFFSMKSFLWLRDEMNEDENVMYRHCFMENVGWGKEKWKK